MYAASTHRGSGHGDMRPASEAIEAEVLLKVWDVLHGTLRWASEANGPFEAGLCDLRGQVHIMKADCEYPNNPLKFSPEAWFYGGTIVNIPPQPIIHT